MSYAATYPRGLGVTPPISTTIENSVAAGLTTAAAVAGPAAPFLLIAAGIAKLLSVIGVGAGCGQPCLLTTEYANQAEALLQQNIATYFCPPDGDCSNFQIDTPRSQTAQAAAMANFNTIWNELVSECSQVSGSVGQQCVSERAAGGCQWKQPASSVPPWGTPAAGDCWNWNNGYYQPIASDPYAVPDSELTGSNATAAGASTNAESNLIAGGVSSSSLETFGLLAAAALAAWWVLK
jgi:hypothetical protein